MFENNLTFLVQTKLKVLANMPPDDGYEHVILSSNSIPSDVYHYTYELFYKLGQHGSAEKVRCSSAFR